MHLSRLLDLVDEGEGLHLEFKRLVPTPEKLARELIAFANTSGGILLVGVDDDGTIVGIVSEKAEEEEVRIAAEEMSDPPVRYSASILSTRGRDILCIDVPESSQKPHFLVSPGQEPCAYMRVGEHSVQASREMVKLMHWGAREEPVRIVIGEAEKRLFAYLETHDTITVREFAHITNVGERRASRLLIRLVRAQVMAIHTGEREDRFSLVREPSPASAEGQSNRGRRTG